MQSSRKPWRWKTRPAAILWPFAGVLVLTACGVSAPSSHLRLEPLPPNIAAPCRRPETFLDAGDWELIAGRMGAELILCGQKQRAAVDAAQAASAAIATH